MRLRDILAFLLLIVVAGIGEILRGEAPAPPAERRPDPAQFAPPPVTGPVIDVHIEERRGSSTGTAFSIGDGIWVSARHVTDGCRRVVLRTPGGPMAVTRVVQQPNADISVLRTRGGAPALPVHRPALRNGDDGFSFGFPRGEPGDVHGRVLGTLSMRATGRYTTVEPVVAWAHVRRAPDRGPALGGISGGPWVDRQGRVVGVHVAGTPRRGRSYSTAPETLLAAIGEAGVRPSSAGSGAVSPANFDTVGDRLRARGTVSQVFCLMSG